ncbi:MAG TPA: DUF2934 domain-containing protein [Candidatus Binatia bacterium]|nr:DUF2934 domain-containing protein [Candidatus Binatia bacterium]
MANENEVNYPAEATVGDQCLREPAHEYRGEEIRLGLSTSEVHRRISQLAYELYLQRGKRPGHDIDDWLAAELLVLSHLMRGVSSDDEETE